MTRSWKSLRLDLSDPNFVGTPERVARMYLEMFHGLFEGFRTGDHHVS
jgi:GTP cyclohydrolase I